MTTHWSEESHAEHMIHQPPSLELLSAQLNVINLRQWRVHAVEIDGIARNSCGAVWCVASPSGSSARSAGCRVMPALMKDLPLSTLPPSFCTTDSSASTLACSMSTGSLDTSIGMSTFGLERSPF